MRKRQLLLASITAAAVFHGPLVAQNDPYQQPYMPVEQKKESVSSAATFHDGGNSYHFSCAKVRDKHFKEDDIILTVTFPNGGRKRYLVEDNHVERLESDQSWGEYLSDALPYLFVGSITGLVGYLIGLEFAPPSSPPAAPFRSAIAQDNGKGKQEG